MDYKNFLIQKVSSGADSGFNPVFMPTFLFDFQAHITDWAIRKGRAAVMADCGLGKTPIQLVWAENVSRYTGGNVLIVTFLAVAQQIVSESHKFNIPAVRSSDGKPAGRITVTNYEKLHLFNPADFKGMVCDESSILKNFDGVRKTEITAFMRKMPYRLLASATPAPNDYTELGTSSECLGYLGYMDMLSKYFKNDQNNCARGRMQGEVIKWRFKGHAELPFWSWVSGWAIAVRKPSDLGYNDGPFILPPLTFEEHISDYKTRRSGSLFALPAVGLAEQRTERKDTINERCEKTAGIINSRVGHSIAWCHMDAEGDMLERLISGSVQVSGKDSDEVKESKFLGFQSGKYKCLVTKPKIGAWGLNFQHCNHMTFFPSHSFEQQYQAIRRCWRFGQKKPVHVDLITTEGERGVLNNLQRKEHQSEKMFEQLIKNIGSGNAESRILTTFDESMEVPTWL